MALGANVNDGVDAGFEKRIVVAGIMRRAAQPQIRRDFIEPTVALNALVDKTNEGKEFVEHIMEKAHKSRIARSGFTGKLETVREGRKVIRKFESL